MSIIHIVLHWLAVHTGTDIPAGQYSVYYNFWSGFGSDISEALILGGIIQIYRRHNCHVKGCWHLSHHKFTDKKAGTEYMLCRKHYRAVHPDLPVDVRIEHLLHIHKQNHADDYER
jgi:hypothetical protein